MIEQETIRVLVVDDDEEDFLLAREVLSEIKGASYKADWANTYPSALIEMARNRHDVCLVDYRLGAQNGVELLQTAIAKGCTAPVIILTGMRQKDVDVAAMKAGAADYLVKGGFDANQLERSIRYALERQRASAHAAFEQGRLAAFGTQVGLELTRRGPLPSVLENCARAMVQYLNAALAQLWTYDPAQHRFVLIANAGPVAARAQAASDSPATALNLSPLQEGKPVILRSLAVSPTFEHKAWAAGERLVSFAAHPLLLEERLVGCMSLYTSEPIAETVLQEMASVANGVALFIERKQAEAALDASESRYRTVVESIKEVVFQITAAGNWSFLNPAWSDITGFTVKDALGNSFLNYIHADDRDLAHRIFQQLVQRESEECGFETRLLTKQGESRLVEVYLRLTMDGKGVVVGASGSLNDITERKLAETQAQKLAAFPRVNPNPVLELGATGELNYENDAARELTKMLCKECVADLLPANFTAIVTECLATGINRLRVEVCLNGRTITWSFFPVVGSAVVHCYGTDITEVLSLEAQYRHAQKLESVGQMAAGVAHDFNNILTIIQGYADCLLLRVNGDQSLNGPLKQIAGASRRAATLTRQLLMFSRKQVIQSRELDLNSVLNEFGKMLPRLLGEDIALETQCADKLPAIEADSGMVEQVVMNLAVNARDAMPNGGCLLITTSATDVTEDYVRERPEARPGHFVCLAVKDTGCGMDAKTLARIFEPFFSTKGVGRGTGLGLATVYGIMKQHEGWVEVSSQVGAGTTFKMYFPALMHRAVESEDHTDDAPAAQGRRETILLVEDEQPLREMVSEILRQYDYRILEAVNGVDALKIWEEHRDEVDLLLTDMVMPGGVGGAELARRLRERKPELRVIYTSGYSSEIVGKNFGENDPVFLQKPYRPPQLAQLVRKCLDSPPHSVLEAIAN